ncbi:DUF6861 domain-containing protein [Rhodanobacter ginsengisoli]|uniref:DUF6861 domain-containing protein n=1 Tax=Rhodanobacter ginsengisoli TaxID=418646 RepID=A0ABW0QML6_9GAMM
MMPGMRGAWIELEQWAHRQASALRADARLLAVRSVCLEDALTLSTRLALEQIERDFHELDVRVIANEIIRLLTECLAIMVATTGTGAVLGGIAGFFGGLGAGAIPGAAAGAALGAEAGEWILAAIGLKVLAEFVVNGLPAIGRTYWEGLREAWLAAQPTASPQSQPHVDPLAVRHAASKMARGHVAMFVLLLMAVVAYVSKGRGSMRELAEKAGNGRLGRKFGEWLLRNESKLKADPRLRSPDKPVAGSGGLNVSHQSGASGPTPPRSSVAKPSPVGRESAVVQKDSIIQRGGAHGEVKGLPGYESHHMPPDSVSPLPTNQGPSIAMKVDDHRMTGSWGSSREARAYRKRQAELLEHGKFREAQKMDVDDVREKFGDKYDEAIDQMLKYTDKKGP